MVHSVICTHSSQIFTNENENRLVFETVSKYIARTKRFEKAHVCYFVLMVGLLHYLFSLHANFYTSENIINVET
jgi:REP element-mobilizing transposase RayT